MNQKNYKTKAKTLKATQKSETKTRHHDNILHFCLSLLLLLIYFVVQVENIVCGGIVGSLVLPTCSFTLLGILRSSAVTIMKYLQ